MKNILKMVLSVLNKVVYVGFVAISIWFIIKVLNLNVIPLKYVYVGLPIYIVLMLILGLLVIFKKVHFIFKILSNILSIILIILIFVINNYIVHTDKFIDNIKEKDYVLKSYYVIALDENKYEDISSFESIGIYSSDEDYNNALGQVTSQFNLNLNTYDDFEKVNDSLFNGNEGIILLSSVDRGILMDKVEHYDEKTTILATLYVQKENNVVVVEYEESEKPFNVLISGIDVTGNISTVSRSDVNMIVTVNPNTHEILLTSIPRDYYVELAGKGAKDKLTHAGIYGVNTSINTIENLLDIEIDYYLKVNFSTVIELVDLIGGIEIYSDKTFTAHTNKNCSFTLGNNYVDGKCALAFSRERYAYIEGDRHRIKNQQDVLMAILNKTITSEEFLKKYFDILDVMEKSFQTNMPKEKIYQLINMQLDNMQPWKIYQYSVDGKGKFDYTYSYGGGKLYVMEPDMNTVAEANKKINELLNK